MTDPIRLARRVSELAGCSRTDAEQYVKGGWVSVDGCIVEDPAHRLTTETVAIDPAARLEAVEPASILLHKPAGYDALVGDHPASSLVQPGTRWADDPSGVRPLQRHMQRLTPLVPLEADATGLMVLTQDGRVRRRLIEDADTIEHEYVVSVSGRIAPYGLRKLNHGLEYNGRALPPCKVSWQSETRLRFAIKGAQPGQLRAMCAQVGLGVVAIHRLRIGRVSLSGMPAGAWRYLPTGQRF